MFADCLVILGVFVFVVLLLVGSLFYDVAVYCVGCSLVLMF